jgi:hypothetical protein
MQYKPIENYYVENVVLGKDFNLGATGSLFHVFAQVTNNVGRLSCLIIVKKIS